ncbi:MAG: CobW family GTP-binding protein [Tangfeifania sp.]
MDNIRNNKISVTVITGFLGAGKTTFINQLLKNYPETQFALVENEFGDISIDTQLIKGVDASQLFELKNGCICCTITNEYEGILAELAERFLQVEHLLIETTGIADPASVARPFFRDGNLKELYQFERCICLVDALNFESLPDREIALKQLAISDETIITKAEQFSEKEKNAFRQNVHEINPLSRIYFADFGKVNEFNLLSAKIANKWPEFPVSSHFHAEIKTETLRFQQPLQKDDFLRKLEYNLDVYNNEIYRAKGILNFEDELYETILQGVGGSFELIEGENLNSGQESILVLIGRLKDVQYNLFY